MNYSLNTNALEFDINEIKLSDTLDLGNEMIEITGIKKSFRSVFNHERERAQKVVMIEITGRTHINRIDKPWGMVRFSPTQVRIEVALA